MLDKKLFFNSVKKLDTGFQLHTDPEDLREYSALLFKDIGIIGLSNDEFDVAVDTFRFNTSGSNFNKLPSTGDFIKLLGLKPKTVEQLAQAQCDLVFSMIATLDMQTRAIFPDKVTNYVLKNYSGGFNTFIWDNSARNENKQELTWRKQAFIKSYISAYESGRESVEPLTLQKNDGRYGALLVDDKEACKANLLEHEDNLLKLVNRPKYDTIEKLTTTFKEK